MANIAPYPQTKIEIIDQSQIEAISFNTDNSPLFFAAFSSDKGTEELTEVKGEQFFKNFGSNISFEKHGQPLLQTAMAINAGARVLCKRIVAPDATLANTIIAVTVTEVDSKLQLVYTAHTVSVNSSKESIDIMAKGLFDDTAGVYPLFAVYDIGRGEMTKTFRITPDYVNSKYSSFFQYNIEVLEGLEKLETISFAMNNDLVYNGMNYSLASAVNNSSSQIKASVYSEETLAFLTKVATFTGKSVNDLYALDILFCNSKTGTALGDVYIDNATSININHVYGLSLESGSNGSFGDKPIDSADYGTELVKVFNGEATTAIYDVVNYQIDAIVDANYPAETKRAIESLAEFRIDLMYFRDMGLVNNIEQMKSVESAAIKNYFSAPYHLSYDVLDPYSKKPIRVTCMYSIIQLLVAHFKGGRHRAFSGELNGAVITDAIAGSVNFIPRKTPTIDQFEELNDERFNYASYYGEKLVLETQYTCQEDYTQLTFANNVMAVQALVKDIRVSCPPLRGTFLDGESLKNYKKDVERIIDRHRSFFKTVRFVYLEDPQYEQNKIFYAAIDVVFRDYIQSEYFKIYAMNE